MWSGTIKKGGKGKTKYIILEHLGTLPRNSQGQCLETDGHTIQTGKQRWHSSNRVGYTAQTEESLQPGQRQAHGLVRVGYTAQNDNWVHSPEQLITQFRNCQGHNSNAQDWNSIKIQKYHSTHWVNYQKLDLLVIVRCTHLQWKPVAKIAHTSRGSGTPSRPKRDKCSQ